MGLAICKKIAVSNGGALEVTSTVGAGSVFTITLPKAIAMREAA